MLSKELSIPQKKCKNKGSQTEDKQFIVQSIIRRRSSPASSLAGDKSGVVLTTNPFRFSPPQYNIRGLTSQDGTPKSRRSELTPRAHIITPPTKDEDDLMKEVGASGIQPRSPSMIDSNDENQQNLLMQTPVRTLFHEAYEEGITLPQNASLEKDVIKSKPLPMVGTPMPSSSSGRLQRSVGRIKSYKEPSLTVKVRKGFKFFTLEEYQKENS